ncbi:MAG: CPBP family intramembrane metalloprotease [Planctomycetaceae bacterium]|nr:CPBP family intramembrane metalloprotease [Planctomycetaceae bacterium]
MSNTENKPSLWEQFPPGMLMTIVAVQTEGGLAVAAILISWFLGFPLLGMIEFTSTAFFEGAIAAAPIMLFFGCFFLFPWRSVEFVRRFLKTVYLDFIRHCSVTQLLLISILAGIGEELMFRGVLQTGVAQWIGGTNGQITGLLIASLAFGLVHPISKWYVLICFLVGIYLGLLFLRSDNLLIPMVAHAFYDFCAFLYLPRIVRFKTK